MLITHKEMLSFYTLFTVQDNVKAMLKPSNVISNIHETNHQQLFHSLMILFKVVMSMHLCRMLKFPSSMNMVFRTS